MEQQDSKQMSTDEIAKLPRAMRRHFKRISGITIRGINEMHINPKKNKKGLLDIVKKYN